MDLFYWLRHQKHVSSVRIRTNLIQWDVRLAFFATASAENIFPVSKLLSPTVRTKVKEANNVAPAQPEY
jgi:hypothetical protein